MFGAMLMRTIIVYTIFMFVPAVSLLEGDSCVFESHPGTCKRLNLCVPLVQLVVQAGRPMPKHVRDTLSQASCGGFVKNDPLVCCTPTQDKVDPGGVAPNSDLTTENPQLNVDTSSTSFRLPNVASHRNLRLLPSSCGRVEEDRILGGNRTGLFEFPWMVLIAYNSPRGIKLSCGGTLVSARYVLTAAHCVSNLGSRLQLAGVVVGDHDVRTDPDCERIEGEETCAPRSQNVTIEEAIPHPRYSRTELHNDIALIRLSEEVNLSLDNVKTICLPTSRELQALDLSRLNLVVAGWGATESGLASPVLLKVDLPFVPTEQCARIYNGSAKIDVRQVCAGGLGNHDSCGGDSGGPLMYPAMTAGDVRYVQHGVVSFGHVRCGTVGYPGVYTRVGYYVDWLLDNMRD